MKRNTRAFTITLPFFIFWVFVLTANNKVKALSEDPPKGTCCPATDSDCVLGDVIVYDRYYSETAPCSENEN